MKDKYLITKNVEISGILDLNEDDVPCIFIEDEEYTLEAIVNSLMGMNINIKGYAENV